MVRKRWMALLLAAMLLCGSAMAESHEDWYLDAAFELAGEVGELAQDEAYLQTIFTAVASDGVLEALAVADYSVLKGAYRLELMDAEDFSAVIGLTSGGRLSDAGQRKIEQQLPSYALNGYGGTKGAQAIAIMAGLTTSRTYGMPEDFEPCLYILGFDGANVGVGFSKTGEDTITATAMPIPDAEPVELDDLARQFRQYCPGIPEKVR